MNFMGKNTGGDSGSSNGSRTHHQQRVGGGGGNSFEEDDEEERQNTTGPTGQLFPSSSSSSPSSSHHQYQPPSFHPQPPYHHQNPGAGWMHIGETSVPVTPAPDGNNNDDQQSAGEGMMMMMTMVEREHMFDKVVTPSDVGKLNRLVIPKQHAERFFPLDSSTNDKGLLLNFEDRNGKAWRFRYSYWNSSQSYVMTKGWSRFVKDKKLDAGDIVSFQRGVGGSAKDRLFIDWRHRPDAPPNPPPYQLSSNLSFPLPHHQFSFNSRNNIIHPWNPLFLQSQPAVPSRRHSSNLMFPPSSSSSSTYHPYGNSTSGPNYHNIGTGNIVNVNQGGSGSVIYFRSGGIPQQHVDMMQMQHGSGVRTRIGIEIDPPPLPLPPPAPSAHVVFESVPVVHGKAAAKRLRLFGVNMDCPISDDDDQDYDPASELPIAMVASTNAMSTIPMGTYHHHPPTPSSSTIPYQQLRPYEEESEFHQTSMMSSSSTTDPFNKTTKSSSSPMSLDFGI